MTRVIGGISKAQSRRKPRQIEAQSQRLLFQRIRLDHRTKHLCIFAVPNGGKRDARTAALMRAEGVTAGVPDIFVAVPKLDILSYGLFIEMKRPNAYQTPAQKDYAKKLEEHGYHVRVCYSADEAWDVLMDYLGISP